MQRELPAGLSQQQRIALSEFYAGRVSAGQLTQRLSVARAEATLDVGDAATSEIPVIRERWRRSWLPALLQAAAQRWQPEHQ